MVYSLHRILFGIKRNEVPIHIPKFLWIIPAHLMLRKKKELSQNTTYYKFHLYEMFQKYKSTETASRFEIVREEWGLIAVVQSLKLDSVSVALTSVSPIGLQRPSPLNLWKRNANQRHPN